MTGVTAIMVALGRGAPPLSVTADTASGSGSPGLITTSVGPNTTPSGGTGPYTYAWSYQSGDTNISVSSFTAQNPTWSKTMGNFALTDATWLVTVTDSLSATASASITVNLESF
jgi:hypothetical protein